MITFVLLLKRKCPFKDTLHLYAGTGVCDTMSFVSVRGCVCLLEYATFCHKPSSLNTKVTKLKRDESGN